MSVFNKQKFVVQQKVSEIFKANLIRLRGGKSQAEVAREMGFNSQQAYEHYEKTERVPADDVLETIAAFYRIPTTNLLLPNLGAETKWSQVEQPLREYIREVVAYEIESRMGEFRQVRYSLQKPGEERLNDSDKKEPPPPPNKKPSSKRATLKELSANAGGAKVGIAPPAPSPSHPADEPSGDK